MTSFNKYLKESEKIDIKKVLPLDGPPVSWSRGMNFLRQISPGIHSYTDPFRRKTIIPGPYVSHYNIQEPIDEEYLEIWRNGIKEFIKTRMNSQASFWNHWVFGGMEVISHYPNDLVVRKETSSDFVRRMNDTGTFVNPEDEAKFLSTVAYRLGSGNQHVGIIFSVLENQKQNKPYPELETLFNQKMIKLLRMFEKSKSPLTFNYLKTFINICLTYTRRTGSKLEQFEPFIIGALRDIPNFRNPIFKLYPKMYKAGYVMKLENLPGRVLGYFF